LATLLLTGGGWMRTDSTGVFWVWDTSASMLGEVQAWKNMNQTEIAGRDLE